MSLVDVVALVPLLAGTALLAGGLWQRRQALDATLTRRLWLARAGFLVAGLVLALLVTAVFANFPVSNSSASERLTLPLTVRVDLR